MATSDVRPQPIPRRDAFFGLHFDLHPSQIDTALGADTSADNIRALLRRVRPDYVQYDCKGHVGYTGYPTQVGWPSPGIVQDALAIWRQVTREAGVGLYIHYSGLWDSAAIAHHPEWACINADGTPDPNATSVFGPYVDELMIPQLKEVAAAYDLDGFWVDGECWAAKPDYSPVALAAWQQETGLTDAPRGRDDPHWLEWKMFHRRAFERYLAHWVDALHAFNPRLQITSNWMYTTFAPQPVVAPLDFLSGDYAPTLSVDRARVEARYLAQTGMPWDLMAWGFNWFQDSGHELKTARQLQQEAAVVLMQGGGFQIYYQPTRAGYVIPQIIETAGEVADFCRARQEVSHKSESVPQVALLLSSTSLWDRMDRLYQPSHCYDELEGALHALLESHYAVDILAEHQLLPRLSDYPLVVVADAHRMDDATRDALLARVDAGGSLLLLGAETARLFAPALGVHLDCPPEETKAQLNTGAGIVSVPGMWQRVTPVRAAPVAFRYATRDTRAQGEVAATVMAYGRGRIGAVYGPVALTHYRTHHPALRRLIADLAVRLFPAPAARVDAPPCVEIALRRTRSGALALHLLNLAETQRADRFLAPDFIPPVGPIEIALDVSQEPRAVRWVGEDAPLEWSWHDGVLRARLHRLHVHGVLVVA